ncbi:hypothetical protein [Trueperella sp. LYQ143]|uniref:variant leucine-rich repeat-containing protein n=1 Tax=Trueperella sp. LYQ143 TaxID=3391059 RepID=UPI003982E06D
MGESQDFAALAADPQTPLETLHYIAAQYPQLRPAIALNPSTYPALLEWLGQLGDPTVDAALAQRGSEGASYLNADEGMRETAVDAAGSYWESENTVVDSAEVAGETADTDGMTETSVMPAAGEYSTDDRSLENLQSANEAVDSVDAVAWEDEKPSGADEMAHTMVNAVVADVPDMPAEMATSAALAGMASDTSDMSVGSADVPPLGVPSADMSADMLTAHYAGEASHQEFSPDEAHISDAGAAQTGAPQPDSYLEYDAQTAETDSADVEMLEAEAAGAQASQIAAAEADTVQATSVDTATDTAHIDALDTAENTAEDTAEAGAPSATEWQDYPQTSYMAGAMRAEEPAGAESTPDASNRSTEYIPRYSPGYSESAPISYPVAGSPVAAHEYSASQSSAQNHAPANAVLAEEASVPAYQQAAYVPQTVNPSPAYNEQKKDNSRKGLVWWILSGIVIILGLLLAAWLIFGGKGKDAEDPNASQPKATSSVEKTEPKETKPASPSPSASQSSDGKTKEDADNGDKTTLTEADYAQQMHSISCVDMQKITQTTMKYAKQAGDIPESEFLASPYAQTITKEVHELGARCGSASAEYLSAMLQAQSSSKNLAELGEKISADFKPATPTPSPSSTSQPGALAGGFYTPTGNISCTFPQNDPHIGVQCTIYADQNGQSASYVLQPGTGGTDNVSGGSVVQLDQSQYGSTFTHAGVTCSVAREGVTCTRNGTSDRIFLSREGHGAF